MAARADYEHLDVGAVVATAESVQARVAARFPDRQLGEVAGAVRAAAARAADAGRRTPLRKVVRLVCTLAAAAVGVGTVAALVIVVRDAVHAADGRASFDWLPVIESAVNDLAFAAIATFFLLTVSQRLDRHAIVAELHRLRSLAHVIDMHQLTKDPTMVLGGMPTTEMSPERHMSEFELARYLDYCAEMLALTAKLAALYASGSKDEQVISAVNEVENLASNLGRKIWQKIMILSQLDEGRAGRR